MKKKDLFTVERIPSFDEILREYYGYTPERTRREAAVAHERMMEETDELEALITMSERLAD